MIELVALNGVVVRVSSFQQKTAESPHEFDLVALATAGAGSRDIDHVLNDQRLTLELFREDGTRDGFDVCVAALDRREIGPPGAVRVRYQVKLIEDQSPPESPSPGDLIAAIDDVMVRLQHLRELLLTGTD